MSSTSYDPRKLIADVTKLLEERGVSVDPARGSADDRFAGAGSLLRGLGVDPLATVEDTLDLDGHRRYNTNVHED